MSHSTAKLLLISFICLLATSAVASYVLYTQQQEGQAIKESLYRLRVWESLQQPGLQKDGIDEAQQEKDKLKSLVLKSESDTVSFLATIDRLSSETNTVVKVNNLEIKKTKEVGFDDLEASFSVVGDTQAVATMIQVFESLPYVSKIQSLKFDRSMEGKSNASLTLLVSVRE